MSWSQIGVPKGDFLPKGARFFFVSDCPELHYNSDSLSVSISPRCYALEPTEPDTG
jgi:hypothetical protein